MDPDNFVIITSTYHKIVAFIIAKQFFESYFYLLSRNDMFSMGFLSFVNNDFSSVGLVISKVFLAILNN